MKKKLDKKNLAELLRNKGFKVTPGRLKLLSILVNSPVPVSAEQILKKMKSTFIDRATVYRIVSSFSQAGIIKKVDLHGGSDYFELNDSHHHHLVCTDCGTIEDFEHCTMDKAVRSILKASSFKKINSHSLELFGICEKCAV